MTFPLCRCLLKLSIRNDIFLSTPSFKCFLNKIYQCLHLWFCSAGEFFIMLFTAKQYPPLKAFIQFPWWCARHWQNAVQMKISSSSKATFMSYQRAPAWPWVGTIKQRGHMKLFLQKLRVRVIHMKNMQSKDYAIFVFTVYFKYWNFWQHTWSDEQIQTNTNIIKLLLQHINVLQGL